MSPPATRTRPSRSSVDEWKAWAETISPASCHAALAASRGAADLVARGDGVGVGATDGAATDVGAELGVTAIDKSGDKDGDGEAAALVHPTAMKTDRSEKATTLDT